MTIESTDPNYGIEMEAAAKVFLELAACLRSDPVLQARIQTWVVPGRPGWLGDRVADFGRLIAPGAVPTAADCPVLKMVPEPRDGQPMDEANQDATLTARIEVWLATSDPLSLLNFWGRIQKAYFGGTNDDRRAVRTRLTAAGAWTGQVLIEQPMLGSSRQQQGQPAASLIGAEGSISVTYKIAGG